MGICIDVAVEKTSRSEQTVWCDEGLTFLTGRMNEQLPISMSHVELGVVASPFCLVQFMFHVRKWELNRVCHFVDRPDNHRKSPLLWLGFAHQVWRTTPLRGSITIYEIHFQKLVSERFEELSLTVTVFS